jgi:hypothetical protein
MLYSTYHDVYLHHNQYMLKISLNPFLKISFYRVFHLFHYNTHPYLYIIYSSSNHYPYTIFLSLYSTHFMMSLNYYYYFECLPLYLYYLISNVVTSFIFLNYIYIYQLIQSYTLYNRK